MWKYKKAIYCGIGAGLLYSFYVFIFSISTSTELYNISDIIMKTYTYHFFSSLLLFCILYKSNQLSLMIYRYKTISQYQKMTFISDLIDIFIYFGITTTIQILMNILCVNDANIGILIFQNFVMLAISCIFAHLYTYIIMKNKILLLILMFLFWNFEMGIFLILPGSILGTWNIFAIYTYVDIVVVFRYISIAFMIICITQYVFDNKERGVKVWLE